MTEEQLQKIRDTIQASALPNDEKQQLIASLNSAAGVADPFQSSNFEAELEAFLMQLKLQSENTLGKNIDAIKALTSGLRQGRPAQSLVVATYAMTNNWMDLVSGLIAPWKQFTTDIED